jgi:ADP-heptose:LPS heptosyltransferase
MPVEFDKIPDVGKIAVLRANAIGDYIFALPALEALRAAYPQAEIVLLGQPWHAGFLDGRPGPVDRVIVAPRTRGIREDREAPGAEADPAELEQFFTAMQAERFDLAVQLHGGGRNSNPFVRRFDARVTIGLKTPDAPPLDRWIPYIYYQPEVLRYLEAVALAGASVTTVVPRIAVTEQDLAESYRVVPETEQPLVLLHPGAGDIRRRWPAEKFAAVGDALAAAGAQILVNGVGFETQIIDQVIQAMHSPAQNLCEQVTLGGLVGLLSRCRLVVSNDSGPLHLATAVGTPTVGIFWCGNLINAGPVTRARHRPLISWRLHCPICGSDTTKEDRCNHAVSFVADILVEDVLSAARELLGGDKEHGL